MTEPGYVKIIHPETQAVAEVPESSLPHHYRAGWTLLDESPEPEPETVPPPARRRKAAEAAQDTDKQEGE